MENEVTQKRTNSRLEPRPGFGSTRRRNGKPKDRLTAKVLAAEAAGYGCHYGQFVADHPDALKDWEPGQELPKIGPKVYEITCTACGKTFTTTNPKRKYCDDLCKDRKSSADYRARKKHEEENAK